MSVRVLFHNHPGRVPDRRTVDFWMDQQADHDVMASAEAVHLFGHRIDGATIAERLEAAGWDTFPGHGRQDAGGATPMFWRRKRFSLWGANPTKHYEDTPVGSWGAGPPVMKAAWTQCVTLRDRRLEEGRFWRPMAGHWVPSVTQSRAAVAKQGRDALASWEERRRLHRIETAGVARMMEASTRDHPHVPVFVLGDYNAEPGSSLLDELENVAEPFFPGPTHGRRRIDGLYLARRSPARVASMRVIPGPLADDHDAVSYVMRYGRFPAASATL